METIEMKRQNEEILNRWRSIGLLAGLKEGSINEWRCAKSFENVANYILNNKYESYSLEVFAFPFIRRVLCTGKKRLYRILSGEEVCDFLTTVTVRDCVEYIKKKVKTEIGKTLLKIIENYLAYVDETMHASDASLTVFIDGIRSGGTQTEEMFNALMKGVFDFEAELLSAATNIFVERNVKKEKEG